MTGHHDLPDAAIRVTALCVPCHRNVTTDGSNRCPRCGEETAPESRGKRHIVGLSLVSGQGAAPPARIAPAAPSKPVERPERPQEPATGAGEPVVLPAIAAGWYGETAALYAQFEHQEAEALVRFEQARADVLTARKAKQAIGKILSVVTVETEPEALAEPEPVAPKPRRVKRAPRPAPEAITLPPDDPRPGPSHPDYVTKTEAPKRSNTKLAPGQWSRRFERCVTCGQTDVPHASRGRCRKCWDRERRR